MQNRFFFQQIRIDTIRAWILLLLLSMSGCTIRLISDYDENTDKEIVDVDRKIESLFLSLEKSAGTNEGEYSRFENAYKDIRVGLNVLKARAVSREKNDIQVQQIDLLLGSLKNMEDLHKGNLTKEQLPPLKTAFIVSIQAILKLEIAKKRG
jgi:hypothetical protein